MNHGEYFVSRLLYTSCPRGKAAERNRFAPLHPRYSFFPAGLLDRLTTGPEQKRLPCIKTLPSPIHNLIPLRIHRVIQDRFKGVEGGNRPLHTTPFFITLGKNRDPVYSTPMFRDAFTKLDALEVEALLPRLNPLIAGSDYAARNVTILAMEPSFYPGWRLLEISDHSAIPARKSFIVYRAEEAVVLDWTNQPIYRLNEIVPVRLDEQNIVEYVRFFFTFVRGRHGRFLITESVDDIAWKDEPPAPARKAIAALIEPTKLRAMDENGAFHLSTRMIFKDSLFKSNVIVTPAGLVTLEDEELVVENIPILDDTLGL